MSDKVVEFAEFEPNGHTRYRDRVGARNLAVIRKLVLNAPLKEKSIKGGIAKKQ